MLPPLYCSTEEADEAVDEARRRLRECFAFVGLMERWKESMWLFSRTFRGATRVDAMRARENTRPGTYDRTRAHLAGFEDLDTQLYADARRLFEARLSRARESPEACAGQSSGRDPR